MITQKFEVLPDERRLAIMVDLLRHENAFLKERVRSLESQREQNSAKAEETEKLLDTMQKVIDTQNAEYFSHKHKSLEIK